MKKAIYYASLVCVLLVFFHAIFGLQVLDISRDNWLLKFGSDSLADYSYWKYFQFHTGPEAWRAFDGYSGQLTGFGNAGAFLPAFFAKILYRIFKADAFQYFGWLLLISYFLQAYFSDKLLKVLHVQLSFQRWIMVLLMTIQFPLIMRHPHISLCHQWLIPATLVLYFNKNLSLRFVLISLFIISFCAATIHPYLILFPLAIGAAIALRWVKENKAKWWVIPRMVGCSVAAIFLGFYVSGVFLLPSGNSSGQGLGWFSSNWDTFINNGGHTNFKWLSWPTALAGQYEGAAYLGLGIIALYLFLLFQKSFRCATLQVIKNNWPIALITFILFVYAVSFQLTFGKFAPFILDTYEPNRLLKILSIFRSSGRFIWLAHLLLLVWPLLFIYRNKSAKWSFAVLLLVGILQFWDFQPIFKRVYFFEAYKPSPVQSVLNELANASERVYVYPCFGRDIAYFQDIQLITVATAKKGRYITAGHLPRPDQLVQARIVDTIKKQMSGDTWLLGNNSMVMINLADVYLFNTCKADSLVDVYNYDQYAFIVPKLNNAVQALCKKYQFQKDNKTIISITEYLQEHKNNWIVIAAMDDASYSLPHSFKEYTSGFNSKLAHIQLRETYIGIWHQEQVVYENIGKENLAYATRIANKKNNQLEVISGDVITKTQSKIMVDGKLELPGSRGLNIVVINDDGEIISRKTFDTYQSAFANRED